MINMDRDLLVDLMPMLFRLLYETTKITKTRKITKAQITYTMFYKALQGNYRIFLHFPTGLDLGFLTLVNSES